MPTTVPIKPFRGITAIAQLSARVLFAGCLALPALSYPVAAEDNAQVKSIRFNLTNVLTANTIRVISTDGKRWDAIKPGPLTISVDAAIDVKRGIGAFRGNVVQAGMFVGNCTGSLCGHQPMLAGWPNGEGDWSFKGDVTFHPAAKFQVSNGNGIPTTSYGNDIVRACNQHLTEGPRTRHTFTWPVTFTLSANTNTSQYATAPSAGEFNGGDANKSTQIRLGVECVPYESMEAGADPVEVTADVQTVQGVCPSRTTVRTRIVYHYQRQVKFDIVRNGKVMKTVTAAPERIAVSHGPDLWVVDRTDEVESPAGQGMFRIIVKDGGRSALKLVNVECAPFQVLFSDLKYNVPGDNSCPAKVPETVNFITNGPGKATYQIVQEDGSAFYEKEVEAVLKDGQYRLVGKRVLTIYKDTNRKFKAQIKGSDGIHTAWVPLNVKCVNQKEGPKDLVAEPENRDDKANPSVKIATPPSPKPARAEPTKPVRVTPDKPTGPRLVCNGGKVSHGKCICRKGRLVTPLGGNRFECRAVEVRTTPPAKPAALTCKGGKVRGNACKCGRAMEAVKVGKTAYVCRKEAPKRVDTGKPQRANAVKPKRANASKLQCQGGRIVRGACACPKGEVLARGRCVRPVR